jgi:hypothetical protein
MNDWQTFIKDGTSDFLSRLSVSNNEINSILENQSMKKYFSSDQAELNTLLDLSKLAASNMVFGKWVAKKIPLIACVELSLKQAYNGLDYLLSFNRIIKAQNINGTVLNAAKSIQKKIDDNYLALKNCQ